MGTDANAVRVRFDFEGSLALARKLWALGDHVERLRASRQTKEDFAGARWRGKYADEFHARMRQEADNNVAVAGALRREAQEWAECWTRAMDEQNRRNRALQVDVVREKRDGGEKFGDFWVGDDSDSQVKGASAATTPQSPAFWPTCVEMRYS